MVDQGEELELAEALDRFSRKADRLLKTENTNTAKIEVNAGGAGVWIATTACLVMLGIVVVREIQNAQNFARIETNFANEVKELREKDSAHDAWIQVINNTKQDKGRN